MGKKGQYYIVGAAILVFVLASLIASKGYDAQSLASDTNQYVFDNLYIDLAHLSNVIIAENRTTESMEHSLGSYFNLTKDFVKNKNLFIEGYMFVGVPYENSLNVTIVNLYNASFSDMNLNISSISSLTTIPAESIKTVSFVDVFNTTSEIEVSYRIVELDEGLSFNVTQKTFSVFRLTLIGPGTKITSLEKRL
ncbi:MAG: hypothetical protein K0B02_00945 [DPANN group archaeon]|nr:hypothetical protein [DPANN group archaeon]